MRLPATHRPLPSIHVSTRRPHIRGIGFRTADAIATRLGIEKSAMIRIRAGIGSALTEAMDDEHCGLPAAELLSRTAELLEAPADLIRAATDPELAAGNVVADEAGETPCIFLAGDVP